MSLLARLENRFRRFAVPNVTAILIAGQVVVYAVTFFQPPANPPQPDAPATPLLVEKLDLVPAAVLSGEVWRLFTFIFVPPISNLICAFFFWYLFYLMGTALEATWGAFRYNVYLVIGYAATVGASFVTPSMPATNGFLAGSVFLAFAHLYPNFKICLFFILPVKVKWLAQLTWIGYFLAFVGGEWTLRVMVTASVANFLLFFGREIVARMKGGHRRMAGQARRIIESPPLRIHRCNICGITSEDDPRLDFRYCSKCAGDYCYCPAHLRVMRTLPKRPIRRRGSLACFAFYRLPPMFWSQSGASFVALAVRTGRILPLCAARPASNSCRAHTTPPLRLLPYRAPRGRQGPRQVRKTSGWRFPLPSR